jgi:hypothetical protein
MLVIHLWLRADSLLVDAWLARPTTAVFELTGAAIVKQFFFSFHYPEKNTSRPDAGDEIASFQKRSPQKTHDQAASDTQ